MDIAYCVDFILATVNIRILEFFFFNIIIHV